MVGQAVAYGGGLARAVHSAAAPAQSSRRRSAGRRIAAQSTATVTDVDTAAPAGDLAGPDALSSPPQLPPAGQLGQRPVPGHPGAAWTEPAAGADMVLGASASSAAHPVALADCRTLPAQASLEAALVALQHAVAELPAESGAYASAFLRLEVPVPRGPHPLWWLRGQAEPFSPATPDTAASAAAAASLHPRIYFSPRRTTAADTEGSAAASAAAAGAGSVAGCGAAWLWRGAPGQALDEAVVRNMQRFLAASAANLRVRAFGGARFNAAQAPAAEWAEFGSYCFLIPRLELLEASGCNILACTVAWDASYSGAGSSSGSVGFASAEAAVADALAALAAVQPAAPPAAGAFKLQRHGAAHTPDESGWRQLMEGTHAELAAAAATASAEAAEQRARGCAAAGGVVDACTPMLKICPDTAREEYLLNGQEGLDDLLAALDGGFEATTAPQDGGLTKVVLARRTDVAITGRLDPLSLLEALGERDPRAYQIMLQMPSGATFLGSTPECLYTRTGSSVASEAVAGTRARGAGGDVEQDFWLAFDLLRSHKDHVEFTVVRDWVQQALSGVCERVQVDVAKSVLKQGAVQHLYGKLSAQLKPGASDAHLLAALHPTPAVCGRPREDAMGLLAASEPFDRGFYAGPFGWIGHEAAEFVVAIRSALVQPQGAARALPAAAAAEQQLAARLASHADAGPGPQSSAASSGSGAAAGRVTHDSDGSGAAAALASDAADSSSSLPRDEGQNGTLVSLFAGVGIVRGSDTASEWAELDLKVRQYERLLQAAPRLAAAPNINSLWARLLVEELCRLGCNTFCVAPGSRSSPLTVAVAQHPRARIVPCIDERSLGFWALGYGRATGRPAVVITSSGTAVANLLPCVVEASQSGVPLLLVTGDRPAELRDSGANQTIDQVKMFGGYTRWHADLPAPVDALPARTVLSAVDTAVAAARGLPPGPVHLNCQFREPLAPVEAGAWDRACLAGLQRWEASDAPFMMAAPAVSASPALQLGGAAPLAAAASAPAEPAAQAALREILGARRGLIVAAELTHPDDVVAATQLSQLLGWPVAADVLSGLRAGVRGAPVVGSAAAAAGQPAVIHHFDHLLLLDRQQWGALRPDVVLQLGGHLTSKRLSQFLEWCCLEGEAHGEPGASPQEPPLTWVLADRSPKRHDQSHLLSHRLQAPLPQLATQLAAQLAAQPAEAEGLEAAATVARRADQARYRSLLLALDREASAAMDAALAAMPELTEPAVARVLARQLPPGEGLFVGNSMPIRDLDMYASPAAGGAAQQGVVGSALGAPVAANRGASGIDGVLSTAAGFADGLGRGTTLVVGDLSFLHDINGLNLLRSGDARPPLTVVLINNSGGGIFSFLPIADALPEDVFTPLWATPQHVDLEGMCRAHGIPHQKVTAADDLPGALRSAWSCNRHSVIEVVTSRLTNVDRHREVQAAVKRAVGAALHLLEGLAPQQQPPAAEQLVLGSNIAAVAACSPYELALQSANYHAFSLPLARPLTTAAGAGDEPGYRRGFLLRVTLCDADGRNSAHGVGEVAPLPGLHRETLQDAEQQLALLCGLLSGSSNSGDGPASSDPKGFAGPRMPLTAALLGGRFSSWLERGLGVSPASLLPSVRSGLEAALLSAVAQHRGLSVAELLAGSLCSPLGASGAAQLAPAVAVNGLLDCQGTPEEAAAEAVALLRSRPFAALKVKVGRRADPSEDVAAVLAIRQAVGPGVVLRADANRRWSLEQAVQFAQSVAPAGLQYVEEPLSCPAELADLHRRTGLPLALDESVDEGLVGPGAPDSDAMCEGVAALVLKPAVLGGCERTAELAAWARRRGMLCVLSSSFESSLGVAQLAQLAVALDAAAGPAGCTQHGLATLSWFAEDLLPSTSGTPQLLQPLAPPAGANGSSHRGMGMGISLAASEQVAAGAAALALGLDARQAADAGPQAWQHASRRRCNVQTALGPYQLFLHEVLPRDVQIGGSSGGPATGQQPVLFLHGFLGGAEDWLPLMRALGLQRRCVAVDLPGHGGTSTGDGSASASGNVNGSNGSNGGSDRSSSGPDGSPHSLEAAAAAVAALVEREGLQGCCLVGYSLGARVALLLAARWPHLFSSVVSISGTPGLSDPSARAERAARDDALAAALRDAGLPRFLDHWYRLPMWGPLRQHPRFGPMLAQRRQAGDVEQLAAVLAAASPGRAPSLWGELPAAAAAGSLPPLLLVAGQQDGKFVSVAEKLAGLLAQGSGDAGAARVAQVPGCGHAVHVERPAELLALLQSFLGSCA